MPLLTSFYLDRASAVHRLHPRVKMIWVLVVFVAVMSFNSPVYQAVIVGGVFALGAAAHLTPGDLLSRVRPVLLIALLIAAVWALFGPAGPPVWDFWIFHVSTTSLSYGIAAGLRVVTLAVAFFLVLETTEQADILYGLISMRVPYHFAFIITSIFRFAPTISGEMSVIREAQRARAMDFDSGSIIVRVRKSMSFVIPLLVRVLKTTVELSLAISSKAYGAYPTRTFYRQRRMTGAEYALAVGLPLVAAGCVAVRLLGFGAVVPGTL
jgi:energy-coupling factor transport system permease protein